MAGFRPFWALRPRRVYAWSLTAFPNGATRFDFDERGAMRFRGTVVDVRERRSSARRHRTLYGPVVAFDHPATGRREQVEPSSFGRDTFERGDPIELAYDRLGDRMLVVPKRPLRDAIALPSIGVVLIALQIADWVV